MGGVQSTVLAHTSDYILFQDKQTNISAPLKLSQNFHRYLLKIVLISLMYVKAFVFGISLALISC